MEVSEHSCTLLILICGVMMKSDIIVVLYIKHDPSLEQKHSLLSVFRGRSKGGVGGAEITQLIIYYCISMFQLEFATVAIRLN